MLEILREVNAVLAVVTVALLGYRTPQALKGVASRRLFLALCAFPVIVGLGSGLNAILGLKPGPLTPLITAAYIFLGYVCIRWPKRLR